jgi:hypothetical protein
MAISARAMTAVRTVSAPAPKVTGKEACRPKFHVSIAPDHVSTANAKNAVATKNVEAITAVV